MIIIEVFDFGERLKELRENRGLSQTQAGKIVGVSKATMSAYERNLREPKIEVLIKMANLYKTSIDYMTNRTNTPVLVLDGFSKNEADAIVTIVNTIKNEFK